MTSRGDLVYNKRMKLYQITQIKPFMSALLSGEGFSDFLLIEGKLQTAVTFTMQGRYVGAYFKEADADERPAEEYLAWRDAAPVFLHLIRGKRTPVSFQFIFTLPRQESAQTDDARKQLTVRFAGGDLHVYSALSTPEAAFFQDREAQKEREAAWDAEVLAFLTRCGFAFEEV